MTVTEKVAYIKGLVDGLDLDAKKDEVKVIKAIIELLDDMAMSVSDLEEGLDVVSDQVDEIDEDLSDLEGYVYEDEDGQVFEDFSDDVLQNEVVPILMSFPNVVVTSHQAFFTRTALQSIAITTMENARAFARGEKLVNEVKG